MSRSLLTTVVCVCIVCVCIVCVCIVWVDTAGMGSAVAADEPTGRFADISPRSAEVLADLLTRIDGLAIEDLIDVDPVVIVVHGPEAPVFLRRNYRANKAVVDLAARLDALGIADIRMCETWMRQNGVVREDLTPFVDTVRFAPEELERLEAGGYIRF